MPSPFSTPDRLTIKASGSGATFRYEPAWVRWTGAVLALVVLVALVVVIVGLPHWPHSLFTTPFVVFGVLVGPHRRRQLITDGLAADAAFRAAALHGREVRPGTWRIEGPLAKPLADQLSQAQYGERAAVARLNASLDGVEPNHVPIDRFQSGDPWPSLPQQAAPEAWPLFTHGSAADGERSGPV